MGKTTLKLDIISAEKHLFSGEVVSVVVPGTSGKFGIYPHHAALISSMQKGAIIYTLPGGETKTVDVNGGIVEINQNAATICVM